MKSKKLILLSILMCFCMVLFVGCTYSLPYTAKISRYESELTQTEQTLVLDESDFEGLSEESKTQLIAEKYISISFTVLIYQVIETTTAGNTTTEEIQYSFGSGFIVHTGGYILTNNHVVEYLNIDPTIAYDGAITTKTYYKCYVSQDGAETIYGAQLLWSNSIFDMAIIICEDFDDLDAAVLKDRTVFCSDEEKVNVLEEVITVGTQSNLEYYATSTTGEITSNLLRVAVSDGNLYEHLIQHNAVINHGNSGGSLIDMDGNVIGLNTLGDDSSNSLFFAISIYPAIAVLDKVVENYESDQETTEEIVFGFMGTDVEHIKYSDSTIDFSGEGVYVAESGSICIISGLQVGDVITGMTITTVDEIKSFEITDQNTLLYARIGLLYAQSGTVTVLRNGVSTTLSISL